MANYGNYRNPQFGLRIPRELLDKIRYIGFGRAGGVLAHQIHPPRLFFTDAVPRNASRREKCG